MVQMDSKVPSLVGFATKDATEKDSRVTLGYKINCKDNKFTEITCYNKFNLRRFYLS
jgi:hypothetical protein